jgi:hypothetical protein
VASFPHASKICACCLLLLAISGCLLVVYAQPMTLTPESVLKEIEMKGAGAVVAELWDTENAADWERLLDKIGTGADAWLKVARKIKPGTDAAATEGLRVSLAVALTHNPEGVLRMVPETAPLEAVCSIPFIESTKARDMMHIRNVRLALKRVTSRDLQEKRANCRTLINEAAKLEMAQRPKTE